MFIRLRDDCTTASIEGRCSAALYARIHRTLTYLEPGYRFTPEYKRGLWDGKRCLLNQRKGTFPAGLVDRVVLCLDDAGFDCPVLDDRPPLPWGDDPGVPELRGITLHDDQAYALMAFLKIGRGCVVLPTGSGKTELAAALFKLIHPARALFIVGRKTLMAQTAERMAQRLGEKVGMLGGGFKQSKSRVTIATVQTLWAHAARMKAHLFPHVTALVVDEAHTISPKMWFKTLAMIPAPVRLGLSATIKEASRRLVVESYLGPILHEQSMTDLVATGRVARPRVKMLRVGGIVADDTPAVMYEQGIVHHDQRNQRIIEAVLKAARLSLPTLVLVVRIEHGRILRAMLNGPRGDGIIVPFVHGQTPLEEVADAKRDLEAGRIPALIASTIFDTGQDVPNIRVLILAGAQRSALLVIQRLGRGTRAKATGENVVDVLDFFDQSCQMFRSQAEQRERVFKRKGFQAAVISSLDEFLEG